MKIETELTQRINERNRAARALLAEKGARAWTRNDQQIYDGLLDDAEVAMAALDAIKAPKSHRNMFGSQGDQEGLRIFLRKRAGEMSSEEARKVRNTMSTTVGSQGGFTVAPLVAASFSDAMKGYGWMRQVAEQITTTSGANMTYPASDGTSEIGEPMGENQPATLQDMAFSPRLLNAAKVSSKIFTVPIELLQDSSVDVVEMVLGRARARIGRYQNLQFTMGVDTAGPLGLVALASVGKFGAAGQAASISYNDLADMAESVDEGWLSAPDAQSAGRGPRYGWMFGQVMRRTIRKVKDDSGRPVWIPAYQGPGISETASRAHLLDYPVFINNDMPQPQANAKSLAFGNLGSYLIRDVAELVLHRFDDSEFTKKGQVGFLAIARAGGSLLDTESVKLYQHPAA